MELGASLSVPEAERTDSVPSPTTTAASPTTTRESLPEVEEPPPEPRQLIGTWREIDGPTFFRFNRDGTFVVNTDKLDVPYYATGTYELEGETIAFTSNGPPALASAADCGKSQVLRIAGRVAAGGGEMPPAGIEPAHAV